MIDDSKQELLVAYILDEPFSSRQCLHTMTAKIGLFVLMAMR
jgi:hypothetical protein